MKGNRREFFRVNFDPYLVAEVDGGGWSIPIQIKDMSVGGMGVQSFSEFFEGQKVRIKFTLMGKTFTVNSEVIRKTYMGNLYEYGIKFEVDQKLSTELFRLLNLYLIQNRK